MKAFGIFRTVFHLGCENILEMDNGDGCVMWRVYLMPLIYM